jgi:hypothetical protein
MIRFLFAYWLPVALYGFAAFLVGVWVGLREGRRGR